MMTTLTEALNNGNDLIRSDLGAFELAGTEPKNRSDPIRSVRDRDRRVGGLPSEKQIGAGIGATERRWDRWSSAIGARAGSARFGRERK